MYICFFYLQIVNVVLKQLLYHNVELSKGSYETTVGPSRRIISSSVKY